MNPLVSGYHRVSKRGMARPGLLVLAVGLALGISGVVAYQKVPSGFMPAMDEGGFILDYKSPPGTALQDTDAMLPQVETSISATPEIPSYSRGTGPQLGCVL